MAIQKFGQLAAVVIPATSTLTEVYVVDAGRKADVNINIANSADTPTDIALVHIKSGLVAAVAATDYLMGGSGVGLPTSTLSHHLSPVTFSGLAMGAGDSIGVWSSDSPLSVQINGIEEDA